MHAPIGCTNGWRCVLSVLGFDGDYLSPGAPTRKETADRLERSRSSVGGRWFLFVLALRARGSPNRTHGRIAHSANRLCTRGGRASVLPSPKAEAGTPRRSGRCRRSRGPRLGGPKGRGAHSHRGSTRSRRATKLEQPPPPTSKMRGPNHHHDSVEFVHYPGDAIGSTGLLLPTPGDLIAT